MRHWIWPLLFACMPWLGCQDPAGDEHVPEIRLPTGKADGVAEVLPEDCPGGAPALVDGRPAAWTIMVYQAGDNNLEKYLDEDLNEMERGLRDTPQVHVLVQQDRASQDGVWRYEVRHDSDPEVIASRLVGHSDQEPDTGDWRTLASFGLWAITCYPAENYVLVVSGHGSGWSVDATEPADGTPEGTGDATDPESGEPTADATDPRILRDREESWRSGEPYRAIAFDDTSGTSLGVDGLAEALDFLSEAARRETDPTYVNRLVVYGSDACLMQTAEVLQVLRGVTYVIGSERTEPAKGWPYYSILRELSERPFYYARAPHEFARLVVASYRTSYGPRGGQGHKENLTLSAVNLQASRRLTRDMARITELLLALYEEIHEHVWLARSDAPVYENAYVDLAEFLLQVKARLTEAGLMPRRYEHWDGDERLRTLRNLIDKTVDDLHEATEANLAAPAAEPDGLAEGVSIYFPGHEESWVLPLADYRFSAFARRTGWDRFLERILQDHEAWDSWWW